MVVLLNKIGKEISKQKKIGSIFITKEILQTGIDLDYKHEWKYRHRFGKIEYIEKMSTCSVLL